MPSLLCSGSNRSILLYGDVAAFRKWANGLSRPPWQRLSALLARLGDYSREDMLRMGHVWKYETGTDPPIYVVKRDQARLYCCMKGEDIVILGWDTKKQNKADQLLLRRMQKLAREVLDEQ